MSVWFPVNVGLRQGCVISQNNDNKTNRHKDPN